MLADLACAIADGAEVISDFRVIGDQEDLFGLVASVPTACRYPHLGLPVLPDRDALVAAAMQRCHAEMLQAADDAEAARQDPALALHARILAQAAWVQEHPGIHKVMHESKVGMPFKEILFRRTTAAVQRCMDAGVAPPGDAATVALDLRAAVIGMLSLRINEPDLPWPPFPEQVDRFLSKLVGLALPTGETTVSQAK